MRLSPHAASLTLLATLALLSSACTTARPANPSFNLTIDQARDALHEMAHSPKPLPRPLVIVGGYGDPNVSTTYLRSQFRKLTTGAQIVTVVIGFCSSFEQCRQKIIDAVDQACPTSDPQWTTEVDVVGASLGGLAARYAAAPSREPGHPRRLKIARLFSIASPHSGAVLAKTAALNQLQADMRPGSDFLNYLAHHDPDARYALFPYARLNDHLVGEHYAAPPGVTPLWLPTPPLEGGHGGAWYDPRILADIARHLRNEPPFTHTPPTPLPEEDAKQ